MAIAASVLALFTYFTQTGPAAWAIVSAAAIYTVGVFGVTIGFNVPRNQYLDKLVARSTEAEDYWTHEFYPNWTLWNHVRTLASAVAAVTFLVGASLMPHFTSFIASQ